VIAQGPFGGGGPENFARNGTICPRRAFPLQTTSGGEDMHFAVFMQGWIMVAIVAATTLA
jgi:hypothetical protein